MTRITTFYFALLAFFLFGGTMSAQAPQISRDLQFSTINTATIAGNPATKQNPNIVTIPLQKDYSNFRAGGCPDTLFCVDFQDQMIPATWGNIDNDGLTDANGRPQDWFLTNDLETTPLPNGDTNRVIASSSWMQGFVCCADNWLVLDSFTVCDSLALLWKSAPFEGPAFMDGYEVLLSTTGNNIATDFTVTLETFAESIGGSPTNFSPGIVHNDYNGNRGILEQRQVDLSAYIGQTVYIAFHHNSDDDNMIMLDDICVAMPPSPIMFDASLIERDYSSEYAFLPFDHVPNMITFDGEVENAGSMDLNNVKLNMDLWLNGAPEWNTADSVATLASGATQVFNLPGSYMVTQMPPTGTDVYEAAFTASSNETDEVPADNSDTLVFFVTDTVYGRDNNVITGALSIGAGSEGIMGQEYDMLVNDTITTVSFFLTQPTVGDTVQVVVYTMAPIQPSIPFQQIGSSQEIIITDPNPQFYTVPVTDDATGGCLTVAAGSSYMVGLRESTASSATLGTAADKFTEDRSWVFFNGSWGNSEDFGFVVSYVLRANVGDPALSCAPLSAEAQLLDEEVVVYPNPTTGAVNIALGMQQNTDVNITITDVLGKVVATKAYNNVSNKVVALDLNKQADGIYIVKVETPASVITRKINLVK